MTFFSEGFGHIETSSLNMCNIALYFHFILFIKLHNSMSLSRNGLLEFPKFTRMSPKDDATNLLRFLLSEVVVRVHNQICLTIYYSALEGHIYHLSMKMHHFV